MAPRRTALLLLAALVVPTLAPAAAAVVCDPEPECLAGVAADAGAPALDAVAAGYALAAPWLAWGEHYAGLLLDPVVPDNAESIVLAGTGVATVRLASGTSGTCGGEPRMVLEASEKSFGLEPTATMSYAAGQGEGSLAFPCAQGEQRQPSEAEVFGDFGGAWYATKTFPTYTWRLDVAAPEPDGTRGVTYVYQHLDGTRHTFEGTLAEYR